MSLYSYFSHPFYSVRRSDPFDVFGPIPGFDTSFAAALHGNDYTRPHNLGAMQLSDTEVKVAVDAKHFKPEELNVKIVQNEVIIHGQHEEKDDEHGSVSREFTRRYTLPPDVDPATVTSSLSQGGILSICAPRKGPQAVARSIPITIEEKPALEGEAAKE